MPVLCPQLGDITWLQGQKSPLHLLPQHSPPQLFWPSLPPSWPSAVPPSSFALPHHDSCLPQTSHLTCCLIWWLDELVWGLASAVLFQLSPQGRSWQPNKTTVLLEHVTGKPDNLTVILESSVKNKKNNYKYTSKKYSRITRHHNFLSHPSTANQLYGEILTSFHLLALKASISCSEFFTSSTCIDTMSQKPARSSQVVGNSSPADPALKRNVMVRFSVSPLT